MAVILSTRNRDFRRQLEGRWNSEPAACQALVEAVARIIDDVRSRGDDALLELASRFDLLNLNRRDLLVDQDEIESQASRTSPDQVAALEVAERRIRGIHSRQVPQDREWSDSVGARLGWKWNPVSRCGLYIPGGSAAYPSTVLMTAIPAELAGVPKICAASPMGTGPMPLFMSAVRMVGISRLYRIGGAQAVAAFAYGTETVVPVDKVVGPGNAFVAEAKRQVYGAVGVDLLAGPSEVVVVADIDANPDWIAADLLAQAEHDAASKTLAMCCSEDQALGVESAIRQQIGSLPRQSIAARSWSRSGSLLVVRSVDEACDIVNDLAPEHVQLMVGNPEKYATRIRTAGTVLAGYWAATAISDYVAGSSHVLPTAGSARYSAALSVQDYMKKVTLLHIEEDAFTELGPYAAVLARAEGLGGHARSIETRMNRYEA